MGNTHDELNIELSIRTFLWDRLSYKKNIPIVIATDLDDEQLMLDKLCYYYININEGRMGDPRVTTDITYHIRAKQDACPGDRDGKWVKEIGNYVKTEIQLADRQLWNAGSFPLYDFKRNIPDMQLELFHQSGDISHIAEYLQTDSLQRLGCFWLYQWGEARTEKIEQYFDYGRTITVMHFAPDIIRTQ